MKTFNVVYYNSWSTIFISLNILIQQLDNVAIESGNARRYFRGIYGDAKNHGEIFGVENMFELRTNGKIVTKEILKVFQSEFSYLFYP